VIERTLTIGDLPLECGATLRDVKQQVTMYGTPDEDGGNVECIGHLNLGMALHPVVLTDGRYSEQAREEAPDVTVSDRRAALVELVAETLRDAGWRVPYVPVALWVSRTVGTSSASVYRFGLLSSGVARRRALYGMGSLARDGDQPQGMREPAVEGVEDDEGDIECDNDGERVAEARRGVAIAVNAMAVVECH